jgi:hypothetical protein
VDKEKVKQMLRDGQSPRQIAERLGYSRTQVEDLASKLQAAQKQKRKKILQLCLGIIVLAGSVYFLGNRMFREPTDMEANMSVLSIASEIKPKAEAETWFLYGKKPKTDQDFQEEYNLIQTLTARLNKALTNNADVPQVAELAKLFEGKLLPTIFENGLTRFVTTDVNPQEKIQAGAVEVVFFDRASFDHPIIGHRLLHFQPEYGLIVAALKFGDDSWYDAMIAHELWHAKTFREGNPSATAPMLTDSWIKEEMDAHTIENQVLNKRTSGKYQDQINRIVSQNHARTLKDLLVQLHPEEFSKLDGLFSPAIPEEIDLRTAQYLLDVGRTWAKSNFKGEDITTKENEIYRYLITPISTNVR